MTDTEKEDLSEDELRFYKEMVNLRNESFTIPGLKQSDTEHNFYRKLYQYHKAKIEEAEKMARINTISDVDYYAQRNIEAIIYETDIQPLLGDMLKAIK